MSIYLSIWLSRRLCTYLPTYVYLRVYLSIYLPAYLRYYLPSCPLATPVDLSVYASYQSLKVGSLSKISEHPVLSKTNKHIKQPDRLKWLHESTTPFATPVDTPNEANESLRPRRSPLSQLPPAGSSLVPEDRLTKESSGEMAQGHRSRVFLGSFLPMSFKIACLPSYRGTSVFWVFPFTNRIFLAIIYIIAPFWGRSHMEYVGVRTSWGCVGVLRRGRKRFALLPQLDKLEEFFTIFMHENRRDPIYCSNANPEKMPNQLVSKFAETSTRIQNKSFEETN